MIVIPPGATTAPRAPSEVKTRPLTGGAVDRRDDDEQEGRQRERGEAMPRGTASERRAQVGGETLCELAKISERRLGIAAAMVGELRLDPSRKGTADPDAVELDSGGCARRSCEHRLDGARERPPLRALPPECCPAAP